MVQKLTGAVVSFDWHPTDLVAMKHAAAVLGAYKRSCSKIADYWTNPDPRPDPQFPDVYEYTSSDGTTHRITYIRRIPEKLLFSAVTEDDPISKLLLKFTPRYCRELHEYCAAKGFAPSLLGCSNIGGGWTMVVMEDVSATHSTLANVRHVPPTHSSHFHQLVEAMHK